MSILASCQKLPATVPDLANRPRQLVLPTPLDSQLNDYLNEVHQIARWEPSIVERIDEDLDLHAKKKKLLRLTDAQFLAGVSAWSGLKAQGAFLGPGSCSAPESSQRCYRRIITRFNDQ